MDEEEAGVEDGFHADKKGASSSWLAAVLAGC